MEEGFDKFFYLYRERDEGQYQPATRKMIRDAMLTLQAEFKEIHEKLEQKKEQ